MSAIRQQLEAAILAIRAQRSGLPRAADLSDGTILELVNDEPGLVGLIQDLAIETSTAAIDFAKFADAFDRRLARIAGVPLEVKPPAEAAGLLN